MVAKPITVIQMLPGLTEGGVERGTLEMGAFLSRKGHRSIVLSKGGRLVPQLRSEGSIHLNWRVGEKNPISLVYLVPLRRLLIKEKVDILHLRSRMPAWLGYLAWKSLPVRLRPRLVTTFHGFYSVNAYSKVMTKGEKVVAISKAVEGHIMAAYGVPGDRIEVIHRGFDADSFDPHKVSRSRISELRERWSVETESGPVLMLPGRLTRLKGHELFIKSLSAIRDLPWQAVCVGEVQENPGYVRELKQLLNQLGLAHRVRFVGYCEDMPAAYLLSDLVVSANIETPEAFGRIAVEAQAMGRPVAATALGGSLETILPGKTGWLTTPGDEKAMASALAQGIEDASLRTDFGKNGQAWVEEKFTVDRMCNQTLELYYQLLSQDRLCRSSNMR